MSFKIAEIGQSLLQYCQNSLYVWALKQIIDINERFKVCVLTFTVSISYWKSLSQDAFRKNIEAYLKNLHQLQYCYDVDEHLWRSSHQMTSLKDKKRGFQNSDEKLESNELG